MVNIFYGCTATEIRKVAFEYAENLNIKHNFNQSSKMAGRDWLVSFMARNNISVRKPDNQFGCPAPDPLVENVSMAPGPVYSPVPDTSKQVDPAVSSDIVSKLIKLLEKTHTHYDLC